MLDNSNQFTLDVYSCFDGYYLAKTFSYGPAQRISPFFETEFLALLQLLSASTGAEITILD